MAFPSIYHDQWNYWSKRGGILFDRLRLASLFLKCMHECKNSLYLKTGMEVWSENQITKLPLIQ